MRYKSKTQTLVMTALFAALLCVLSPMAIPIGPIPFTLGIFAVYLVGAMLPFPAGLASLAVYILIGVCGLPVFSGFRGGPQVLVGATGGYIVGYFFIVAATSLTAKFSKRYWVRLLGGLGGMVVCYAIGTLWYAFITGASFLSGLAVCVVPFVIPDIIKAALAIGLAQALANKLGRQRL